MNSHEMGKTGQNSEGEWNEKKPCQSKVISNVVCSPLQAELTLREGSGYFFVNGSVGSLADVLYQDGQATAEVGILFTITCLYLWGSGITEVVESCEARVYPTIVDLTVLNVCVLYSTLNFSFVHCCIEYCCCIHCVV